MTSNDVCICSIGCLRILSELQNIHDVVDAEMILDLVYRLCRQGETMVQCKSCIQIPQPSMVTLPALFEKCLALLEALFSTYDIATQPGFFDSAMLAMEQPTSRFICIRNTALLGQMELDGNETSLLVRMIIGQRLRRILNLMESLNGSVFVMLENSHSCQNRTAALRNLKSSVESTIGRLRALMETVDERNASSLT